jgi:hypothetical protein
MLIGQFPNFLPSTSIEQVNDALALIRVVKLDRHILYSAQEYESKAA